ncbi:MAG: 30S ribosomal protein S19e [Candidatus Diapherotrites archaeon]
MGIYDVPATELIDAIAEEFKATLKQPDFVKWVKSGAHRERAPLRPDWFYVRAASVLYRVYKDGPVGTESLRTYYGGKKNRGVRPEKFKKASGKVIRACLQALEKEGLIKRAKKGRGISSKGESFLSKTAKEVAVKIKNRRPVVKELALRKEVKDQAATEVKEALKGQEDRKKAKEKGIGKKKEMPKKEEQSK